MPSAHRVAVFDRAATFRRGLRSVLEEAGFAVVDGGGDDDPSLGDIDACVFTIESEGDVARIGEVDDDVPVVALLRDMDLTGAISALRAGAAAVIPWSAEPEVIVAALRAAEGGLVTLPEAVAAELASRVRPSTTAVLDEREAEWLRFLADGKTVARLADEVGYSEREMFRLLADIYRRLGASNRSEALVKAVRLGVLED